MSTSEEPRGLSLWESVLTLKRAFDEQQSIVKAMQERANRLILSPAGTPAEYRVRLDPTPKPLLTLRRNLFSTLFQSTYHLLGIPSERRQLYGSINYLFRIWVTSADNLLDNEDKVTLPIDMPGQSRVMRQVVAIMAADRILTQLIDEAVQGGILERQEAAILSSESLQVLLPSAAQEATEEGGITDRPHPDQLLEVIHRLKTGLLFHLPFLGPERIEAAVSRTRIDALKASLMEFGLGCQILDDIRDMARDHRERRHNYILSHLRWSHDPFLRALELRQPGLDERLYTEVPHAVLPAAKLAMTKLCTGLAGMNRAGLELHQRSIHTMAETLFDTLDLAELKYAL